MSETAGTVTEHTDWYGHHNAYADCPTCGHKCLVRRDYATGEWFAVCPLGPHEERAA